MWMWGVVLQSSSLWGRKTSEEQLNISKPDFNISIWFLNFLNPLLTARCWGHKQVKVFCVFAEIKFVRCRRLQHQTVPVHSFVKLFTYISCENVLNSDFSVDKCYFFLPLQTLTGAVHDCLWATPACHWHWHQFILCILSNMFLNGFLGFFCLFDTPSPLRPFWFVCPVFTSSF